MPVVVGGGFGGVLFHEMTGHGLEADHVQKGASVYAGKLGEAVAQPLLTAYDDGRMPGEWGSDAIDDEGAPTQKTQVIEDGRLVAFLHDRQSAKRDGAAPTGNGRRESFRDLPIPRMTNTYIAPGEAEPEAIIGDVEQGFYAVSFAGGQVDPATGDFVFGVNEGYLIEDGEVTRPCRGATLVGNCLQALAAIDAVGNDFWMKTGICGKGGQKVPVGTGQGHVRIASMTVGGTRGVSDLAELAARAVERAVAAGAGDAEAYASEAENREVRVHGGEVESLTAATQRGLGLRVWIGGRVGYGFGTDLSPAGIEAIAARAVEAARVADEDEFAGPPDEGGEPPVLAGLERRLARRVVAGPDRRPGAGGGADGAGGRRQDRRGRAGRLLRQRRARRDRRLRGAGRRVRDDELLRLPAGPGGGRGRP